MLYGFDLIGGKDWYRWGAEILVANQQPNGNWQNGGYPGSSNTLDTCLALLFRCQPLFPCLLQLAVSLGLGRSAIFLLLKFGLLHTHMPNECVAAHAN